MFPNNLVFGNEVIDPKKSQTQKKTCPKDMSFFQEHLLLRFFFVSNDPWQAWSPGEKMGWGCDPAALDPFFWDTSWGSVFGPPLKALSLSVFVRPNTDPHKVCGRLGLHVSPHVQTNTWLTPHFHHWYSWNSDIFDSFISFQKPVPLDKIKKQKITRKTTSKSKHQSQNTGCVLRGNEPALEIRILQGVLFSFLVNYILMLIPAILCAS